MIRRRLARLPVGVVLAANLALCSCMVGPDYKPPKTPPGATGPLLSTRPDAETGALPPDNWWRLYADARLDGYLKEAFAANDDLSAAEYNLSAARAILEATRSGLFPGTSVNAGAIYGRNAQTDQIIEITGHKPVSTWSFDTVFDVSYELDLFGRVRRSIEAAHANAEAVAAARDAVKVTVAAETARAYAQICAGGEELTSARRSLEIASKEADIAAQRYAAGGASRLDVVRTETVASQVRASIPFLEGQRRAALFELGALLGRTPANAPSEALDCMLAPRLVSLIPVGDGAALLKRRPDVREAERNLASATATIGVATADLYPRINLIGSFGNIGSHVSDFTHERALTWGMGPSITWAFPNQIGTRARVRQTEAQTGADLAHFDGVVLGALKEVEQALSLYDAELDRRQALGDAQAEAHEAYGLAHGQLLAGAASTLDLLTAEQTMVATDAAVAASDTALVQDQITVFKALGGGWEQYTAGPRPASGVAATPASAPGAPR